METTQEKKDTGPTAANSLSSESADQTSTKISLSRMLELLTNPSPINKSDNIALVRILNKNLLTSASMTFVCVFTFQDAVNANFSRVSFCGFGKQTPVFQDSVDFKRKIVFQVDWSLHSKLSKAEFSHSFDITRIS